MPGRARSEIASTLEMETPGSALGRGRVAAARPSAIRRRSATGTPGPVGARPAVRMAEFSLREASLSCNEVFYLECPPLAGAHDLPAKAGNAVQRANRSAFHRMVQPHDLPFAQPQKIAQPHLGPFQPYLHRQPGRPAAGPKWPLPIRWFPASRRAQALLRPPRWRTDRAAPAR